jgi:sodium/potassium-transporting ATPase subunit alpha
LTGESEPQERIPTNTHENPLEATNLAFNGSMVVNGEAFGIVIRTGDRTVLGQIAGLAGSEKKRVSPMTKEVTDFVHRITAVAIVTAIVFFGISWTQSNGTLATRITFAIGVFVSFVPEGLPTTMTVIS